jgi:structural maintenance of chromosome 4
MEAREAVESRLMIQKVVLENFKSYAGIKEIGPFHKNFTSVVGPNGSGKSNLLECLLFAFGKRATKMRLKKLSELIHNSKRFPDLTYARVSVYFIDIIDRGDDDYEIVPGSELVLSRIVHKNNSSQYRLNGKDSTYEEVTSVLKQRGIDLEHNRFLILQGEVEQIAMMKPKAVVGEDGKPQGGPGLLEYLEEIIGTNEYVPVIQEIEKELETIADEVTEKKLRLEESEKGLAELEAPKDEAMKYIMLEKEGFEFRNLKYFLSRFQYNKAAIEIEHKIAELGTRKKELQELFQKKKEENKEVIQAYNAKVKEVDAAAETMAGCKKKVQELIREDKRITEEITKLSNKKVKMNDEKSAIDKRCKELEITMKELNVNLPATENKCQELKDQKERVDSQYQELHLNVLRETEHIQKEKQETQTKMQPIKNQHQESKGNLQMVMNKIEMLLNQKKAREDDMGNIEKEIYMNDQLLETKLNDLQEGENYSQSRKKHIVDLRAKVDLSSRKLEEIKHTLNLKKNELASIQKSAQKVQNQSRQMTEIMNAVKLNELRGVLGRLGDLGTIPPKYDVAVSSSVTRLDNIVVESVDDADRVIQFVRERNLGKVTIIALDKVSNSVGHKARARFQVPDARVERLFDQIDFVDDRVKVAFYYAMGDTLVAENLDIARHIAFGGSERWKVVTLSGDIINPSGEMQGFSQPRNGKMRLSGDRRASLSAISADELIGDINELEGNYNRLAGDIRNAQGEITRETKIDNDTTLGMNHMRNEIAAYEKKRRELQVRKEELLNFTEERMDSELIELRKLQNAHQSAVDKTSSMLEKFDKKLKEIEKKIDAVGGPEYSRLKQERETLKNSLEQIESELSKLNNRIKQSQKDAVKLDASQRRLEEEIKTNAEQLQENNLNKERIKKEGEEALEQFQLAEGLHKNKENELKELETQQTQVKQQFEEISQERNKVKISIKELHKDMRKNDQEIEKWNGMIHQNRTKYEEMWKEYADILGNDGDEMELDQQSSVSDEDSEHKEKRFKRNDTDADRKRLTYPISKEFTTAELDVLSNDTEKVQFLQTIIEEELKAAKPNLNVIQQYREKILDRNAKKGFLDQVKSQENDLRNKYNEMKNKRAHEFLTGFTQISSKLREMYQMITRGGDAELEFADTTDPFTEGIVFTVRPPKKSWKKMANLSGGEKTLSSLALVFALHHYKPTALYVMDEVDAALDFQNVSVIANYIKGRTKNAQFIIVSLRYQMFELADKLVGVYKVQDETQTITISPCALKRAPTSNPIIRQTINNISVAS